MTPRDLSRLKGVHPDLMKVVAEAEKLTSVPFTVLEGLRTPERQKQLVAARASKTMNSRHLTGHAVDLGALVDGKLRWDWPLYAGVAAAMKSAAKKMKIAITWGGDWSKFKDGPHFELRWKEYPK